MKLSKSYLNMPTFHTVSTEKDKYIKLLFPVLTNFFFTSAMKNLKEIQAK